MHLMQLKAISLNCSEIEGVLTHVLVSVLRDFGGDSYGDVEPRCSWCQVGRTLRNGVFGDRSRQEVGGVVL